MARKALGKGLEALIPGVRAEGVSGGGEVQWVEAERVRTNRHQPRLRFGERELEELAASIKEVGLLQPLLVRPGDDGFELIAGERRLRAARKAGLRRVPVIVREVKEEECLGLALVENLQRADLSPLEEAAGYQELMEKFGLTQEEVARRVGKSRSAVANTVRLLKLPDEVKRELSRGALSAGHARVLVGLEDAAGQLRVARQIIRRGLSVRETERQFVGRRARGGSKAEQRPADVEVVALARRLSEALGTRVRIKGSVRKGRIEVEYYTGEQLAELGRRIEGAGL